MKECPIIFSGPMVRAILDGTKTQTRRIVKVTHIESSARTVRWENQTAEELMHVCKCPHGAPGDRLWLREAWGHEAESADSCNDPCCGNPDHVWYKASEKDPTIFRKGFWRPSMFMPRWASRLSVELVAVRVERIQDISVEDCVAEGIDLEGEHEGDFGAAEHAGLAGLSCGCSCAEIYPFAKLWNSINGKKHPWASNPFVWVVEFKRLA